MNNEIIILGIESSCDDTSAAVLRNTTLLSSVIASQAVHERYGGVIPELASRAHQQNIVPVVDAALRDAGITPDKIDAIAFTRGPGLLGSLMVGTSFAKGLAIANNIPLVEVNHLHGHILSHFVDMPDKECEHPNFPFLCLLVSGGHTQIVKVNSPFDMEIVGSTIDDAAGEAFDKVAKMLGLGYPGGPLIEKMAELGNENRFVLPKPLYNSPDCNLSFSGLKTAVRKIIESYSNDGSIEHAILPKQDIADICASFQKAATECLLHKLKKATQIFKQNNPDGKHIVVAGGVAANTYLRSKLEQLAKSENLIFAAPPIKFCTDNGVMIAWAGVERAQKGLFNKLDFKPRPRWPLDETAPKAAGAGGVKA